MSRCGAAASLESPSGVAPRPRRTETFNGTASKVWRLARVTLMTWNYCKVVPVCATCISHCQKVDVRSKKKLKVLFYPVLSDFRKRIAFGNVLRLRPFVLLLRATCRWRSVWNIGEMIDREIRSTGRNPCPSATLSTTNLTWTGLVLNMGTAEKRFLKFQFLPHRDPCVSVTNTSRPMLCSELIIVHGEHREPETQCLVKVQNCLMLNLALLITSL